MPKRPNFLIFVIDQMRADWLGCTGHPAVRTPYIDAIAARGTSFTDCHVAAPVCMPGRASLMTGRMPQVHSVRYNGLPLPRRAYTFADVLATAGYDTALIGKSHLQPFTDKPPLRAADTADRLIPEAWAPDGARYDQEEPATYRAPGGGRFDAPYYGFAHVDMVTGHGDKAGGHYDQWLRDTHPDWCRWHAPAHQLPHGDTCPKAYRTPVPEDAHPPGVDRRPGGRVPRHPCERCGTVLRHGFLSRPAPPVQPARARLGHVRSRRFRHRPAV
ncbi:MAG: sulfatase-like hydrolase/transferase [Pseudomonadota bacterium]